MEHKMSIINFLRHKYALTEKGAKDLVWSCCACALQDIVLMMPVGLLYLLVKDLLSGGISRPAFYLWAALAMLVLIAAVALVKYNAQFVSVYIESGKRRISLAEKLRKLPLSYFGKKDLSDLTSTIMADCATIETGTSHWIPELIGSMISTVLICVGCFTFDWRMSLAALWPVPVAIAIVLCSSKGQNRVTRRQSKAVVELADNIQEGLEAFQDIRSANAERQWLSSFRGKVSAVEKAAIRGELGIAYFVVSAQILLRFGIVSVALTGGLLLRGGSLDLLTFFMFLLVASRLYDPMSGALTNLGAAISLNIPCERMDGILSHEEQEGRGELTNKGYDIRFENVLFAYDTGETVLDGVSFTARQGEVTALIGPSGCGKTTVSRLAARFWDIQGGRISVGGMDISKVDPETLLSLYSIVFQDVTLFNNSVMENIRIGRKDATDAEVMEAARLAHVDVFAERLPQGWDTLIGENGCTLSGGERQRISIARAFLKGAPIILLDEATASLDVENETFVQESLSRLIQDKTVIVIAHRMRTVAGADKIVVLKDGRVQQNGAPAVLLAEGGFYKEMTFLQGAAMEWNI